MIAKFPVIQKKILRCLKCGKPFMTDKYHRFCRRCKHENEKLNPRFSTIRMSRECFSGPDISL
jgi:DNA-directed RNA polymerase subunit N (RpoN/RPB10)